MYGKPLDETTIKNGLRELNPAIHFDMLTNIGQWHPHQASRQGVWYEGKHVCSMDRGMIPELKVWSVAQSVVEVSPMEAERHSGAVAVYVQILPSDPFYNEALLRAERKDDNYTQDPDGKVFKWTHLVTKPAKDRVVMVGWRHTFEKLIEANIPGITRQSIGETFGVDMHKYPVGPPEEVEAALTAE